MAQDNRTPNAQQNRTSSEQETEGQAAAAATAKPKAPAPQPERFFIVQETRDIPHKGGAFCLRKGKKISSKGYNIEHLKRIGVKLEELQA